MGSIAERMERAGGGSRTALAAVLALASVAPLACDAFEGEGSDAEPTTALDGSVVDAASAPDAAGVDAAPEPPRCDPNKEFATVERVTELDGTANVGNFTPRLTADGLQIFWTRALTVVDFRIYRATRGSRDAPFVSPVEVTGIGHTTAEFDSHPIPFPDGSGLYFQRSTGGMAGRDILLSAATNDGFTAPQAVGGASSPSVSERAPYLASDLALWFDVSPLDGGSRRRIVRAERVRADVFREWRAVPLGSVADADDVGPVVSADGLVLYFASNRASVGNVRRDWDVWIARRASPADTWGEPTAVAALNGPTDEEPSWISPDGCDLYFQRVVDVQFGIFRARRPL